MWLLSGARPTILQQPLAAGAAARLPRGAWQRWHSSGAAALQQPSIEIDGASNAERQLGPAVLGCSSSSVGSVREYSLPRQYFGLSSEPQHVLLCGWGCAETMTELLLALERGPQVRNGEEGQEAARSRGARAREQVKETRGQPTVPSTWGGAEGRHGRSCAVGCRESQPCAQVALCTQGASAGGRRCTLAVGGTPAWRADTPACPPPTPVCPRACPALPCTGPAPWLFRHPSQPAHRLRGGAG